MVRHKPADLIRRKHKHALRRLLQCLVEQQQQRRQNRKRANQTAQYTFCQNDTHVHAYLQTHQQQHQQADNCRHRTTDNRRNSTQNRRINRLTQRSLNTRIQLLTIAVQQHNRVVQTQYQLQNRSNIIRRNRYARHKEVRSHIDDNRDSCRYQYQ